MFRSVDMIYKKETSIVYNSKKWELREHTREQFLPKYPSLQAKR